MNWSVGWAKCRAKKFSYRRQLLELYEAPKCAIANRNFGQLHRRVRETEVGFRNVRLLRRSLDIAP